VDTIQYIRHHLRLAGLIILFGSFTVLLLIAKLIHGNLETLSPQSVALILWMLTLLAAGGYGLVRMTMQRALSSIDAYREKLDMLLYPSRDIHSVEMHDMLMDKIIDAAYTITAADGAALLLKKQSAVEFNTVRGHNANKLRGRAYPVMAGIIEQVLTAGTPIKADEIGEDDAYKNILYQETGAEIKSVLCIPVISSGKTIGALALCKAAAGHFIKDDEELLQFFITQSVISMKNTEHHEVMNDLKSHLSNFLVEAVERIWGKSGHAKKVAQYALKIGRTLGLDQAAMQHLHDASLLHDIGLLRCDRTLYRTHPMHGHQLLRNITFYQNIAPVVLHHHERIDGSGYPGRLKADAIPLLSRIVGIAEAFDVMTNVNSFLNAAGARVMTMAEAIEELQRSAGSQFDARLVGLFVDVLTQEEVLDPA
jgi:hypothetical protein